MGKRSKRRKRMIREWARIAGSLTYGGGHVYGYMNYPDRIRIKPGDLHFDSANVVSEYLLYSRGAIITVQEVSYGFRYTGVMYDSQT